MTTQEAQRACMERLTKRMEADPTPSAVVTDAPHDAPVTRLYTTAVVVIRSDTHRINGQAEDYQVFRATDGPSAALYARRYHERTHGKPETRSTMDDYQANVYETCVTVLGPDNRPTYPGDYRVFRAVTSREAARYALALYRRIYGTLRPVTEIRTWHQRDMRDSYNLFTPEELND